jgi:broad specificity phosphatase PhoE
MKLRGSRLCPTHCRGHICAAIAAFTLGLGLARTPAIAQQPSSESVVQDLRKGGYVIVVRHMNTDATQADTDTSHLENCAAQRQLTQAGRDDAAAFGAALRRLKIPVGQVMASAYCRALESARLAGFDRIAPSLEISEPQNVPPVEGQRRAAMLRKLVCTPPARGTDTVIITHRPNILDAFGKDFFDVGEGEVLIFEPTAGTPGYRVLTRVAKPGMSTQWAQTLAQ